MLDRFIRNLPHFKGKHRIARLLYKNKLRTATDILVQGKYDCKYVLPNIQENVGLDIFINGVYEKETIGFLEKIIPPQGVFMDLGANIGAILIPLCKKRSDIRAIAVEAAPWIYQYLTKNIALNQLQPVHTLNNALFNEDDLELDFFSPHDKYGKGSLSSVFTKHAVKVITRRVDTIVKDLSFEHIDAIKVDVEGFEYFVFQGAERLLKASSAPDIVFEFVDWAENAAKGLTTGSAQQLLKDMGYTLYNLDGDRPVKLEHIMTSGYANLFASKKSTF